MSPRATAWGPGIPENVSYHLRATVHYHNIAISDMAMYEKLGKLFALNFLEEYSLHNLYALCSIDVPAR